MIRKKIFICFLLFILFIPFIGYIFYRNDKIARGERVINVLNIYEKKRFSKKNFQKNFEKYYFGRYTLVRIKNQFYDWFNFGEFHSAYSGNIIQGKNKQIFEKDYILDMYTRDYDKLEQKIISEKLSFIQNKLKKMNKKMLVVISPSKAIVFEDKLPLLYKKFIKNIDHDSKGSFAKFLRENGINYFNSQILINEIVKDEMLPKPFSYSGTHWNYYGSGATLKESFKEIGVSDIKIENIIFSKTPFVTERDIADILNLPIKYRQHGKNKEKYPKIIFEKYNTIFNKIVVISNSFGGEYTHSILHLGISKQTVNYNNNNFPEKIEDVKKIIEADLLIFVYPSITEPFKYRVNMIYDFLK